MVIQKKMKTNSKKMIKTILHPQLFLNIPMCSRTLNYRFFSWAVWIFCFGLLLLLLVHFTLLFSSSCSCNCNCSLVTFFLKWMFDFVSFSHCGFTFPFIISFICVTPNLYSIPELETYMFSCLLKVT